MKSVPGIDEWAAYDCAVEAMWENCQELRAGVKGSGASLAPAECERLARHLKRPANRPPGILNDLHARLLAGGEGSSNLMLSPADCDLMLNHMAMPKPPEGRKPKDDFLIAWHCLRLEHRMRNREEAVQQTMIDRACSRGDVFRALKKLKQLRDRAK